jgi:hypothetical protein
MVDALGEQGEMTDATIGQLQGLSEAESMLASLSDETTEALNRSIGSYEDLDEAMATVMYSLAGFSDEMIDSEKATKLAAEAAQGSETAIKQLSDAFKNTGMSSKEAENAVIAMIKAIGKFNKTDIDLEATARLVVQVLGNANVNAAVEGTSSVSAPALGSYSYYRDGAIFQRHADGGVMDSPTIFHVGGEAGPEAILPLHNGSDTLQIMDQKLDALLGTPRNIHITTNIAGQKVDEVIVPIVDKHVWDRERTGAIGRTVYAAG